MARTAIHPGEHLGEELRELGMSAAELSRQIGVPVNRVTGIINGQRGVTADTALSLRAAPGATRDRRQGREAAPSRRPQGGAGPYNCTPGAMSRALIDYSAEVRPKQKAA